MDEEVAAKRGRIDGRWYGCDSKKEGRRTKGTRGRKRKMRCGYISRKGRRGTRETKGRKK